MKKPWSIIVPEKKAAYLCIAKVGCWSRTSTWPGPPSPYSRSSFCYGLKAIYEVLNTSCDRFRSIRTRDFFVAIHSGESEHRSIMTGRETIADRSRSTARRIRRGFIFVQPTWDDAKQKGDVSVFLNRPSTAVPYRRLSDLVASCVVALTQPLLAELCRSNWSPRLVTIQSPPGGALRVLIAKRGTSDRISLFSYFFHL